MQLDPVGILAVLVPERRDGGGADLVDDQRAGLQHRAGAEGRVALLRVVIAGGVLLGDDVAVLADAGVAHVVVHRGDFQMGERDAVAAEEVDVVAGGRDLELGVQRLPGDVFVLIGGEDDHMLTRLQRHRGEDEGDLVRAVAQAVALQRDGRIARVGQLDPVGEGAVLVGVGRAVGGHDLGDDQRGIAAGNGGIADLRAGDVRRRRQAELRGKEDEHDQRGTQQKQQRQRAALGLFPPQDAAFPLWWALIPESIGTHAELPFSIRQNCRVHYSIKKIA